MIERSDPTSSRSEPGAPDAGAAPREAQPARVWALLGDKSGDNAQVLALAESLGVAFRQIRVVTGPLSRLPNRLLGAGLLSVRAVEPSLGPPWPELVIAAGRRTVPVARWIQRRSRGRSRLIQIGRPRAPLDWFDLVLAAPQYHLPAAPNVVHTALPISRTGSGTAATAPPPWDARIAAAPAPRVAVLIGGPARAVDLPASAIDRALRCAGARAGRGGSLLISTSPRTPPGRLPAVEQFGRHAVIYRWDRERGRANPLPGFLAAADHIVVTGDSISMLAQAIRTGRPVTVVPPATGVGYRWLAAGRPGNLLRLWQRRLANAPLLTPPPDPVAVLARLVESGQASWRDGVVEIVATGRRLDGVDPDIRARAVGLLTDARQARPSRAKP